MASHASFPAADIAAAVGSKPVWHERVAGGGYGTNTVRWRVAFEDSRRAFVKRAVDKLAVDWLRREHNVYQSIVGPFLPTLLGWHDQRDATLLVVEDLSDADWPPPWRPEWIDAVLTTLDAVHTTMPPSGVDSLESMRDMLDGWPRIAADPVPFLSLGLCSPEWLEGALSTLSAASAECSLVGDAFLHLDVRSDNLCIRAGRAILVDWNWAAVGNPLIDVVAWLPSLRLEGGPEPWKIVPDSGGLAALVAGYFSAFAGLPAPATAPNVRGIQKRQAEVALPWAARELGLPLPARSVDSSS